MSDPRRFIGRNANPCRKCNGIGFYVNRMGGVVCLTCSPPRSAADNCQSLTIEGGVWIDPQDRFDLVDVPIEQRDAVAAAFASSKSSTTSKKTTGAPGAPNEPPINLIRARHSRGPDGELSEAELELFGSPDLWGLPGKLDLIVTYDATIVWVSEMFAASEVADRQRARDASPRTLNKKEERTAAATATASMFSV